MAADTSNLKGAKSTYIPGTMNIGTKAWYEIKKVNWEEHFEQLSPNMTMCYMTMGPEAGQPVFLLHGGGDCRVSWSNIAPILANQGYRVYVPEHRGHGRSSAPETDCGYYTMEDYAADVLALMDKIGIQQADFVGHSCGSLTSQILAIEYSDRVRTISLIATGSQVNGDVANIHLEAVDDEFCHGWAACEIDDPEFCEGIYQYVKQVPLRNWQLMLEGIRHFNTKDRLSAITCPVLIIWGTEDAIFSAADQEVMLKGLCNTSYIFVKMKGCSHSPFWDSLENVQTVSRHILMRLSSSIEDEK